MMQRMSKLVGIFSTLMEDSSLAVPLGDWSGLTTVALL